MVLPQILEGTWEEIKQYETELTGQRLRVFINPDKNSVRSVEESEKEQPQKPRRKLSGYGLFAHIPGGSEAFALEKQKEIEREDSKFE